MSQEILIPPPSADVIYTWPQLKTYLITVAVDIDISAYGSIAPQRLVHVAPPAISAVPMHMAARAVVVAVAVAVNARMNSVADDSSDVVVALNVSTVD